MQNQDLPPIPAPSSPESSSKRITRSARKARRPAGSGDPDQTQSEAPSSRNSIPAQGGRFVSETSNPEGKGGANESSQSRKAPAKAKAASRRRNKGATAADGNDSEAPRPSKRHRVDQVSAQDTVSTPSTTKGRRTAKAVAQDLQKQSGAASRTPSGPASSKLTTTSTKGKHDTLDKDAPVTEQAPTGDQGFGTAESNTAPTNTKPRKARRQRKAQAENDSPSASTTTERADEPDETAKGKTKKAAPRSTTQRSDAEPDAGALHGKPTLSWPKPALRAACKQAGLTGSGTKAELLERLLAHSRQANETARDSRVEKPKQAKADKAQRGRNHPADQMADGDGAQDRDTRNGPAAISVPDNPQDTENTPPSETEDGVAESKGPRASKPNVKESETATTADDAAVDNSLEEVADRTKAKETADGPDPLSKTSRQERIAEDETADAKASEPTSMEPAAEQGSGKTETGVALSEAGKDEVRSNEPICDSDKPERLEMEAGVSLMVTAESAVAEERSGPTQAEAPPRDAASSEDALGQQRKAEGASGPVQEVRSSEVPAHRDPPSADQELATQAERGEPTAVTGHHDEELQGAAGKDTADRARTTNADLSSSGPSPSRASLRESESNVDEEEESRIVVSPSSPVRAKPPPSIAVKNDLEKASAPGEPEASDLIPTDQKSEPEARSNQLATSDSTQVGSAEAKREDAPLPDSRSQDPEATDSAREPESVPTKPMEIEDGTGPGEAPHEMDVSEKPDNDATMVVQKEETGSRTEARGSAEAVTSAGNEQDGDGLGHPRFVAVAATSVGTEQGAFPDVAAKASVSGPHLENSLPTADRPSDEREEEISAEHANQGPAAVASEPEAMAHSDGARTGTPHQDGQTAGKETPHDQMNAPMSDGEDAPVRAGSDEEKQKHASHTDFRDTDITKATTIGNQDTEAVEEVCHQESAQVEQGQQGTATDGDVARADAVDSAHASPQTEAAAPNIAHQAVAHPECADGVVEGLEKDGVKDAAEATAKGAAGADNDSSSPRRDVVGDNPRDQVAEQMSADSNQGSTPSERCSVEPDTQEPTVPPDQSNAPERAANTEVAQGSPDPGDTDAQSPLATAVLPKQRENDDQPFEAGDLNASPGSANLMAPVRAAEIVDASSRDAEIALASSGVDIELEGEVEQTDTAALESPSRNHQARNASERSSPANFENAAQSASGNVAFDLRRDGVLDSRSKSSSPEASIDAAQVTAPPSEERAAREHETGGIFEEEVGSEMQTARHVQADGSSREESENDGFTERADANPEGDLDDYADTPSRSEEYDNEYDDRFESHDTETRDQSARTTDRANATHNAGPTGAEFPDDDPITIGSSSDEADDEEAEEAEEADEEHEEHEEEETSGGSARNDDNAQAQLAVHHDASSASGYEGDESVLSDGGDAAEDAAHRSSTVASNGDAPQRKLAAKKPRGFATHSSYASGEHLDAADCESVVHASGHDNDADTSGPPAENVHDTVADCTNDETAAADTHAYSETRVVVQRPGQEGARAVASASPNVIQNTASEPGTPRPRTGVPTARPPRLPRPGSSRLNSVAHTSSADRRPRPLDGSQRPPLQSTFSSSQPSNADVHAAPIVVESNVPATPLAHRVPKAPPPSPATARPGQAPASLRFRLMEAAQQADAVCNNGGAALSRKGFPQEQEIRQGSVPEATASQSERPEREEEPVASPARSNHVTSPARSEVNGNQDATHRKNPRAIVAQLPTAESTLASLRAGRRNAMERRARAPPALSESMLARLHGIEKKAIMRSRPTKTVVPPRMHRSELWVATPAKVGSGVLTTVRVPLVVRKDNRDLAKDSKARALSLSHTLQAWPERRPTKRRAETPPGVPSDAAESDAATPRDPRLSEKQAAPLTPVEPHLRKRSRSEY